MGSIVLAWMVGLGIVSYRDLVREHVPPPPRQLALASGAFMFAALVAEAAERPGALLAWGLDVAGLMSLLTTGQAIPVIGAAKQKAPRNLPPGSQKP